MRKSHVYQVWNASPDTTEPILNNRYHRWWQGDSVRTVIGSCMLMGLEQAAQKPANKWHPEFIDEQQPGHKQDQ